MIINAKKSVRNKSLNFIVGFVEYFKVNTAAHKIIR